MRFLIGLLVFSSLVSCTSLPNVERKEILLDSRMYKDEIIVSENFKKNYLEKSGLKIVLRVPQAKNSVTGEDTTSSFYINLEKKLVQNGYIVRDRALLERLLDSELVGNNYSSIFNKIDTDLILQIDSIELSKKIYPKTYFIEGERVTEDSNEQFYINFAEINARVVAVKEGEVGVFARLFVVSSDDKGNVSYTIEKKSEKSGLLGISADRVVYKIVNHNNLDIYLEYSTLIDKLLNSILKGK